MRRVSAVAAVAAVAFVPALVLAQGQMDAARSVAGGGISVPGWMGKADGTGSVNEAKFVKEGSGFHITTGPATTYWNAADKASGNYTVKATFDEPKFQNLNSHPHPYGIVIGGNDMGTPNASYLYCAVNGNGSFIVRGMGPAPFQMNGRMGGTNAAVHKAAGVGSPVTNEVAVSVTADKVDCSINGTVVASYPKSELVAAGKLKSTDGLYGLRSAHNTEVMVTGLSMTKQ